MGFITIAREYVWHLFPNINHRGVAKLSTAWPEKGKAVRNTFLAGTMLVFRVWVDFHDFVGSCWLHVLIFGIKYIVGKSDDLNSFETMKIQNPGLVNDLQNLETLELP